MSSGLAFPFAGRLYDSAGDGGLLAIALRRRPSSIHCVIGFACSGRDAQLRGAHRSRLIQIAFAGADEDARQLGKQGSAVGPAADDLLQFGHPGGGLG